MGKKELLTFLMRRNVNWGSVKGWETNRSLPSNWRWIGERIHDSDEGESIGEEDFEMAKEAAEGAL